MSDIEREAQRAFALRLLARREQSRLELIQRLIKRGCDIDMAEALLDELAEAGWQSDQRFAEHYFQVRMNAGFGPLRIRAELQQRGIARATIDALNDDPVNDWQARLEQLYHKKYHDSAPDTQQERAKRSRFLSQRGFSPEQIRRLESHIQPFT